ncbi:wax ester/triacylglycerol synthase family O-acyltransferase [Mycobacterium malmoense]|uniref:wax ester/triacylglycerol synthase family O-acyltransferase n=1 Tax=Mycobacterium malmoense TaxID=1780 RepID=UPI0008F91FD8|nr:wax ester/triacylglycerol synthase family O-acyltransferase [Mycobacterium malmoense]OIN82527.1 diacylglycerol O-acyltransferase [Mycobacterium malmoense]
MAQAKTLDTAFLKAQDPDQHASLATGAVAVVDGAVPDYRLLKRLLAERIQSIPRCTQILRAHPFNQQWIDDPQFDLTHHVRRVAIPRPGDDAELSRAIAHALERPLDPDRPLWECWVIEGLKGNRWAILMKIHHRMADGNSAAHLLARLCDDADGDTFASHVGAKEVLPPRAHRPGWAEALGWAAGVAARAVTGTAGNAATAIGVIWPAARTVRPTTTMRRYSTVRVPLAVVDRVCHKFGVGTNGVALAVVTEGFREMLLHRGEQPRADSLRTLAPPRSATLPYLPVEQHDPIQRLRAVHGRLNQTQPRSKAADFLPSVLCAKALQLLTRLPQSDIVTLATNVPGPRHRLRLMGQTVERLLPIPPTTLQLNTGVAVLSYGDELVFGITADYRAASDIERLAAGIELGMARLEALSRDSVLLFTKNGPRKRASRALTGGAQRGRASAVTVPGRC